MKKCNKVYSLVSKMISLYNIDYKIRKFYNLQIEKITGVISKIETEIEQYSIGKNFDYELKENDKIFFEKLNNKLNECIASYMVENAKFYPNLKFYKKTNKKVPTYKEIKRKRMLINTLKYIGTTIMAVAIGVLVNYISKKLGL